MRNSIILFLLLVTGICPLFGQQIELHPLEDTLNRPLEFSAMDIKHDSIFLLTENCSTLFFLNKETYKILGETSFKAADHSDLEGLSIHNNNAFITDEETNSLFYLNLKTDALTEIAAPGINKEQNLNHDFGLEGVEVNKTGDMLYILKELDKKLESIVYCYRINHENGSVNISLSKTVTIKLDRKYRYSDLALSADGKNLYMLRTRIGGYYIDIVPLNSEEVPDKPTYHFNDFTTIDISSQTNDFAKQGYSSNLEGIAVDEDDSIYIISDNYNGRDNHCDDVVSHKKTLLIKVTL